LEEPEELDLTKEEIAEKVDGYRAIEKVLLLTLNLLLLLLPLPPRVISAGGAGPLRDGAAGC
jgi:hypothetical protein